MAWKKGQSGNPAGRTTGTGGRDRLISDRLRSWLLEPWKGKDDPKERTYADRIAERLVKCAAGPVVEEGAEGPAPNLGAIGMILDRLEGRPMQESSVTIDDKREREDYSRGELAQIIRDARAGSGRAAAKNGRRGASDQVH